MNELFPIIRRKRRPLIEEDAAPQVQPSPTVAGDGEQKRETQKVESAELKPSDENASPITGAR